MAFETFDRYRAEAGGEREGWRRIVGTVLTFSGFTVLVWLVQEFEERLWKRL